jgi:DNA mismatch repair protein MutS2
LKELATEVEGVVNASLQFDAVALAPTYRLLKGVPGRSYGLSIARRLRLPEDVLARAEERVPKAERDVDALLADLERRDEELARREREVSAMGDDLRDRAARVAEREQRVREREREAERAGRQEARRYLLDARAEIERTVRELRAAGAEAIEETARAARQNTERLAAEQGAALERLDERPRDRRTERREPAEADSLGVGDVVELSTFGGRTGRLVDIRDGDGVVAVGALKMTVPLATLRRTAAQPRAAQVAVPVMGDLPEVHAPSEIDLRGMRVNEIDDLVMQALDSAVRADLKQLRIIHGKGTGALRERVTEMLRKDTRVASFRLGAWNEGGAGVTVAEIR